jgi:hypothetical protein
MDLLHVLVDDLESEIFLVPKMVVEGALRDACGGEHGLDAQIVVAMLQ